MIRRIGPSAPLVATNILGATGRCLGTAGLVPMYDGVMPEYLSFVLEQCCSDSHSPPQLGHVGQTAALGRKAREMLEQREQAQAGQTRSFKPRKPSRVTDIVVRSCTSHVSHMCVSHMCVWRRAYGAVPISLASSPPKIVLLPARLPVSHRPRQCYSLITIICCSGGHPCRHYIPADITSCRHYIPADTTSLPTLHRADITSLPTLHRADTTSLPTLHSCRHCIVPTLPRAEVYQRQRHQPRDCSMQTDFTQSIFIVFLSSAGTEQKLEYFKGRMGLQKQWMG